MSSFALAFRRLSLGRKADSPIGMAAAMVAEESVGGLLVDDLRGTVGGARWRGGAGQPLGADPTELVTYGTARLRVNAPRA